MFTVDVQIARPLLRPQYVDVPAAAVGTGSEATWISAAVLRQVGIAVRKRDEEFVTAAGERVRRDVGYAIIRCGEFETIDEVVFAREGDLQLLGGRTIQGFNARVDARNRKLVPG